MEHFINTGFGWTCRRCRDADEESAADRTSERARFFTEGEAERDAKLFANSLACWRDDARQILYCPRCGIEEAIKKEG